MSITYTGRLPNEAILLRILKMTTIQGIHREPLLPTGGRMGARCLNLVPTVTSQKVSAFHPDGRGTVCLNLLNFVLEMV